jgi:hypothetical protein
MLLMLLRRSRGSHIEAAYPSVIEVKGFVTMPRGQDCLIIEA